MEVKISPSMVCADLSRLGEQVQELDAAGVDLLHWDVMDGRYVHNFALSPDVIAACRSHTALPFDVHLAISDPAAFIDETADAGADIISLQLETTPHIYRAVQQIHRRGKQAGVVVTPVTPLSYLESLLPDLAMVTLMTVDVGFAGQSFIWPVLDKASALRRWIEERNLAVDIQLDGQINAPTIGPAVAAGANVLVVGTSGLFTVAPTLRDAVQVVRSQIAAALAQ
jgi:ribulose-phosphate 3-epimerase